MAEKPTERKSKRNPLQTDLSSLLFLGEAMNDCRAVGVDVSSEGLGIIGFEALEVGSAATLRINDKSIKMTIAWCKPDTVRQGVFHAGLNAATGSPSLMDEFQAAGLLVKKPAINAFEFRRIGRKG